MGPHDRVVDLVEAVLDEAPPTDDALRSLARAGWVARAAAAARQRPAETRAPGLAAVAIGAAENSPSIAHTAAAEAHEAAETTDELVQAALALAAVGATETALVALGEARSRRSAWAHHRGATAVDLARVAEAMARAGCPPAARDLAREAESTAAALAATGWREDALARVAAAWSSVGDLDHAREVVRGLTSPWAQVEGWLSVAEADPVPVTAAQDLDRAVAAARAEGFPDWRAEALAGVVRALGDQGLPARAAAVAGEIADPVWWSEARLALAVTAWCAVDPALARRHERAALARARACGYGWWHGVAAGLHRLARARARAAGAAAGLDLRAWAGPAPLQARVVEGTAEGLADRAPTTTGEEDLQAATEAVVALGPCAGRTAAAVALLMLGETLDPSHSTK